MNHVDIYYYSNNEEWTSCQYSKLLSYLSKKEIEDVTRFVRWQDRQNAVAGKMLLRYALNKLDVVFDYSSVRLTDYKKPYLKDGPRFNVSHSGGCTVCAVAKTMDVGVDVELIKSISIDEFIGVFTTEEWAYINKERNSIARFYEIWTRKEAVIKADGRGMYLPLTSINVLENEVKIERINYFIQKFSLEPNLSAHLASTERCTVIVSQIKNLENAGVGG